MKLELNITIGQTITVLILVAIAFAGGFLLNQPTEQVQLEQTQYTGFTDADKNILGNLAYSQGVCERIGLNTAVMPQITDANEVYGIPVCIERTGGE